MVEWLNDYWKYLIVLVVVCVVAFFIFRMAYRAYSQHQKDFKAQEKEILRLLELKKVYENLSVEVIENSPEAETLDGVAVSCQLKLQKQENMEKAFEELSDEKKNIYVLHIFIFDKNARIFFHENGEILTSRLGEAFNMIGEGELYNQLKPYFDMYDVNNEETSLSEEKDKELNDYISSEDILTKIKISGAKYIKDNANAFI